MKVKKIFTIIICVVVTICFTTASLAYGEANNLSVVNARPGERVELPIDTTEIPKSGSSKYKFEAASTLKVDDTANSTSSKGYITVIIPADACCGEYPVYLMIKINNNDDNDENNWSKIQVGTIVVADFPIGEGEEPDYDGDGLPDDWEINGIDANGDGNIDVDLPAMGADPNIKDIFVEVDWMIGKKEFLWWEESDNINNYPSASALKMVHDSFMKHNINLHIDAGPNSIMDFTTGKKWGKLSGGNSFSYSSYTGSFNTEDWNKIALDNLTLERRNSFRHCLFVSSYDNLASTGRGNISGQFFIVASGVIENDIQLAGTFMHELGHTLGLTHGGVYTEENGDIVPVYTNYKPNHISIMNYMYQLSGIKTTDEDVIIDYQDFELPGINETKINENDGIDPEGVTKEKHLKAQIYNKDSYKWLNGEFAEQPIDFNRDGKFEEGLQFDLNPEWTNGKTKHSKYTYLYKTENEWNHLEFKVGSIGGIGLGVDVDQNFFSDSDNEIEELSVDEAFDLGLLGEKDECQFYKSDCKTIYNGLTDKKLRICILNMSPEPTTVKLQVASEVLDSDYLEEIEISKRQNIIEIPVKEELTNGEYDAVYSMTLANGEELTEKGIIKVATPDNVTLNKGYSEEISTEFGNQYISSDDSIIGITGNSIVAKSVGTAYVSNVTDRGDTYCVKVDVVDAISDNVSSIGDINKDGVVDSSDASEVLMLYAQLSTGGGELSDEIKAVADINDDGLVDSSDASLILEYYAYVSTGGTDTADVFFSKSA